MTVATHLCTKLMKAQGSLTSAQACNLNSDTFMALWVKAGSGIPSLSSTGIQFVADITGTNAEDTSIASRATLAGVTWAFDASTTAVDWSWTSVVYAQNGADDGLSRYWVIYDSSQGANDATHPVVLLVDPGATVSTVTGSVTVACPAGGILQFTGGN